MPRQYTPAERAAAFWAKVDRNGPVPAHRPDLGPCWLWTASKTPDGYGKFWQHENGVGLVRAHAWSFIEANGPYPSMLVLDHLCRVILCVRPSHLEAVTNRTNVMRGAGWAPRNLAATHCVNGHEFNESNTYRRPNGARDCRTCICERQRRYQERRKAV